MHLIASGAFSIALCELCFAAMIFSESGNGHLNSPFTRLPMTSRASFSGIRPLSSPRSASIVTSWSATVTVPSIGVLSKPHFALSEKVSTDPCQLRCLTINLTGNPGAPSNRSLNERSTAFMTSALELLCEIVIRMFRPRANPVQHLTTAENRTPRVQNGALGWNMIFLVEVNVRRAGPCLKYIKRLISRYVFRLTLAWSWWVAHPLDLVLQMVRVLTRLAQSNTSKGYSLVRYA
jgi:hypothetical protein